MARNTKEENTLELIDYFRVIWKWKWLVTLTTAGFLLVAVMLNIVMEKVYNISMVLEPAITDFDLSWRPIYLESSLDIKSKVDLGVYDNTILNSMKLDLTKRNVFKTLTPKDSNILKISIEISDVEKGEQALRLLYNLLSEEYKNSIYETKLQILNVKRMKEAHYRNLIEEENQLKEEIKKVESNTERLIEERDVLIKGGGNNADKLSVLIYTNTIHGNIEYKNRLQRQLSNAISEREKIKSELENLKVKLGSIRNIKLLTPPKAAPGPIKPKKSLNLILAFVLGLFISLFLAFLIEYIQKARTRFR